MRIRLTIEGPVDKLLHFFQAWKYELCIDIIVDGHEILECKYLENGRESFLCYSFVMIKSIHHLSLDVDEIKVAT